MEDREFEEGDKVVYIPQKGKAVTDDMLVKPYNIYTVLSVSWIREIKSCHFYLSEIDVPMAIFYSKDFITLKKYRLSKIKKLLNEY